MTDKEKINRPPKIDGMEGLTKREGFTRSGKALVVTLLYRLIFGGYLIGMDQYRFDDVGSALTVLLIYGVIGLFGALFISGRKYGLTGIIVIDAIFIVAQSVFTILALSQRIDPGLHDPQVNWWGTLLMLLFSLLTITFAIRAIREAGLSRTH